MTARRVVQSAVLGPGWDALPLPSVVLDGDGRVAALNDAAELFLNLSRRSALGQQVDGDAIQTKLRISPPLAPTLAKIRDEGIEHFVQPQIRVEIGDRAGGHLTRTGQMHVSPYEGGVMIVLVPADIPDRIGGGHASRNAARQAIGMAEMLAHEIKNPLSGIRGAAQLLGMSASDEDRKFTDLIVAESRRIVSLLDQVERFGDTSPPSLRPVNIHDVLERARRSAGVGFASAMTIVTEYDPSLPAAMVDPDQLVQVFLNLLKNAAEALAPQGGGRIRIRSFYDGSLRAPDACGNSRSLPLQVEIEDNGPGIPEAIADQVFEPFVSGRENGTGLGLPLVSKIVADHGGWLRVESRPGRTVFRISLPKAQE